MAMSLKMLSLQTCFSRYFHFCRIESEPCLDILRQLSV